MSHTLYSFRRCPYAMRARLAIKSANIPCEIREILLRDKPLAFLEASPSGTVPCMLLNDGTVLDESFDIMRWALKQNDPEALLAPNESEMDELIKVCDGEFKLRLDGYKYPNKDFPVVGHTARDDAMKFISTLETRLSNSAFLFGPKISLADLAILPFIRQFAHVDMEWFYAQEWPNVIFWVDGFKSSDAFTAVMKKLPPWQPDDAPITFAEAYAQV